MDKPSLERVSNIAVILTCLAVMAQVGMGIYHRGTADTNPLPSRPVVYPTGAKISDTPGLEFTKAPKTLLLVTNSACHFCSASMPFYKRLTATAKANSTRVVAVTSEDTSTNRNYLQSNGVEFDGVVSATEEGVLVRATPALILVRRDGGVINSWVGQLSSEEEKAVLSNVKSTT